MDERVVCATEMSEDNAAAAVDGDERSRLVDFRCELLCTDLRHPEKNTYRQSGIEIWIEFFLGGDLV